METPNKQPHVIVCGAGIGGLTTAHELAKQGVRVTVYERNPIVGGLARSRYFEKDGHTYPTEYSWRVYGTGYKNIHRLFKEIPLGAESEKTVWDNLVKIGTYIFPRFDKEEVVVSGSKKSGKLDVAFSFADKRKIVEKLLYCLTMSPERMDTLDHLKWRNFCSDLSDEANKYMVTMWGPVLGMDPTHMSFPVVARIMSVLFTGWFGKANALYVMNQPTNDGWFDPWVRHMESTGLVQVHTNHEIVDINMEDNQISSIRVKQPDGEIIEQTADYYVCAMSVEAIAKLVTNNTALQQSKNLRTIPDLAKTGHQVQLSIQLFLDQELIYPTSDKNVLYLPDTPWAIIIEPEAFIWDNTHSTDERVKSVLSIGICQTDVPGIHHKKAFVDCTPQEIEEEVWAQLNKSYHASNIKTASSGPLSSAKTVLFYMWDSFQFDETTQKITIWEPKFSNNAGGLKDQPSTTTDIKNLLFATAYTKTDRFIYSMEAATEAGTRCANEIATRIGSKHQTIVHPFVITFGLFKPLIWLDRFLLRCGAAHASRYLFGSSMLLVIIYVLVILTIIINLIDLIL